MKLFFCVTALLLASACTCAASARTVVVDKGTYIVDCVPFDQQPGIVSLRRRGIKTGFVDKKVDFDDTLFHFKKTDCPAGTVGIPRTNPHARPSKKHPRRVGVDVTYEYYDYIITPYLPTPRANASDITLGLESPPFVTPGAGRSVNQMWWLTNTDGGVDTMSLETGWITSNYTTANVTTSLFVFSTVDGYSDGPDDKYDYAGGFIGYSGAPTLGTPLSSVHFKFSFSLVPGVGYELELFPFTKSSSGVYHMGDVGIPVGLFPLERFPTVPVFNFLQAGAACHTVNKSMAAMRGTIHGFRANNRGFPVAGGAYGRATGDRGTFSWSYSDQRWDNAVYGPTKVTFTGRS
jgi:hypothetical protein